MSIKILLADDSITIQKVIGIIFGTDDYALTIVDNGKDALDKAREIVPDVLLIDALMPGMNGYEVCGAVRSTPSLATKPILLLTGSFEPFDEDKAKSCGADDFLAKPFESQQIVSKVKALFELGKSRASTAALIQPAQKAPAFQAPPEPLEPPAPAATAATGDSAEPGDIWGAFTPPAEPPAPLTKQGGVFAMVNEEPEFETIQPPAPRATQETTGSQWIPVEEQTFEFTPETAGEAPAAAFSEPSFPLREEAAFGDIPLAQTAHRTGPATLGSIPAGEPSVPPPPIPVDEAGTVAAAPAAPPPLAAMSEEQLRAAIMGASREVIERIVWEIVPDLAEAMIKDAILKIQEGR